MTDLHRVGLNLLFLVPGETGGTEVYARNLIPALAEQGRHELVAFVNREAVNLELGVETVRVDVTGRSRAHRVLAEARHLPALVTEHGIQLLHSLGNSAPSRPRATSVVTIHDVIYTRAPEAHTRAMRMGMR